MLRIQREAAGTDSKTWQLDSGSFQNPQRTDTFVGCTGKENPQNVSCFPNRSLEFLAIKVWLVI